jgi:hypothetical protein
MKILIVEDEELAVKKIKKTLSEVEKNFLESLKLIENKSKNK